MIPLILFDGQNAPVNVGRRVSMYFPNKIIPIMVGSTNSQSHRQPTGND